MKRSAAIFAAGVLLTSALSVCRLPASQFGTGFAISPKGYMVTCHHVIRDADRILVHSPHGTLLAKTIAIDPRNDLAILKVEEWKGAHLSLAASSKIRHATTVTALGFPDPTILGRNPKISKGIISALSGIRDDPRFLQTSTPVQPGNSGGPLLSPSGQVIGVIAAGLNGIDRMSHGGYLPQAVNYAVKAEFIYPLLENASVKLPWFNTKTTHPVKQIDRGLSSIVLIEASGRSAPRRQALRAPAPRTPFPQRPATQPNQFALLPPPRPVAFDPVAIRRP